MDENTNTDEHTEQQPTRPADQTDTPDGMKRVRIMRNFTLNRDRGDGTSQTFLLKGSNCGLPGYYDMTPEDADHWWTKANSDDPPPEPEPMPGTPAAREQAQTVMRRRAITQQQVDDAKRAEADKARRGKQSDIRDKLGDSFEQSP